MARSSVEEVISRASSPFHSMVLPVFLKSNRCESSLAAWFSALSTSWRSTLLTMSKLLSAMVSSFRSAARPCVVRPAGRCVSFRTAPHRPNRPVRREVRRVARAANGSGL